MDLRLRGLVQIAVFLLFFFADTLLSLYVTGFAKRDHIPHFIKIEIASVS